MTNKQVTLRLPTGVIMSIKDLAKKAGVTPTQAINVLLALHLAKLECPGDGGSS